MSLGKKVFGVLFEEEESQQEPSKSDPKLTTPTPKPTDKAVSVSDSESFKLLTSSVLTKSHYTRFLQISASLESLVADQTKRAEKALEILGADGITPAQIRDAVNGHLAKLERENIRFLDDIKKKEKSLIREDELKQLNDSITSLQQQIADLQQKLEQSIQSKTTIEGEIVENRKQIDSVLGEFEQSHQALNSQLVSAKEQLERK